MQAPRIDERDGRDLAAQLRRLVLHHAPGALAEPDGAQVTEAMVQVFARFGEIIIDRLNRVPEKNFLAFLQLLGLSNFPPRAASVPLTFYLAPGTEVAVVPARTQMAAKQLPGEKDPVIFETDQELVAVSNRLSALFVKNGKQDLYSDLSQRLPQTLPAPGPMSSPAELAPVTSAFNGDVPIPHAFYIAFTLSSPTPIIDRLMLKLGVRAMENKMQQPSSVEWRLFVPPPPSTKAKAPGQTGTSLAAPPPDLTSAWIAQEPGGDTTEGLTTSGEIAFVSVPVPPAQGNAQTCWLVCRLLTPILQDRASNQSAARPALPASNLPVLESVIASAEIDRGGLALDGALFNTATLDLSKDFYPLGEKPRFGDTLYLASAELFSTQDTTVVLHIEMTNPANAPGETPVPKATPHQVKLAWEFWDGRQWSELGVSEEAAAVRLVSAEGRPASQKTFRDSTSTLSVDGEVTFTFPSPPARVTVGGVANFWVRVRLIAGNYGVEARRQREHLVNEDVPATFAPPMIRAIKGAYSYRRNLPPQSLLTYNDFVWNPISTEGLTESTGSTVQPFQPVTSAEIEPALYFGFDPPATKANASFDGTSTGPVRTTTVPIAMYVDAEESATGISAADRSASNDQVRWEYWNDQGWTALLVRDESNGLRQPGMVRFIAPIDMVAVARFGCTRYWLRAVPPSSRTSARIRTALLNTVMATGSVTYRDEELGVSNGMPEPGFALLHKPVLDGQQILVLEPQVPSHADLEALQTEEGADCIHFAPASSTDTRVWVRWHPVEDFASSGPRDRHYLLDRLNGFVRFGDGLHGHIPPRGGKIRVAVYRTGGGSVGNRPAGNITQLKTAVPSIKGAWNWFPSVGGGNAEPNGALLTRGPRTLRHGGRAATAQDYEDLACQASLEVARARCVPLRDLAADPGGKQHKPGYVSIIVVPVSSEPRPMPSLQLLECVLDYLGRVSPPQVQLSAVAPTYVHVDVTTEVVMDDPGSTYQVQAAVQTALAAYLHPLTGGTAGSGWAFGAVPHKSDLYARIARLPGVSHVRSVETFTMADHAGTEQTDRFLISPGTMTVSLTLSDGQFKAAGDETCR